MPRKMMGLRSWGPGLLLLWAALASCSGDSDFSLQAVIGSSVVLPCDAPPGSDLENLALEWTRPDLKDNYVFLFRDGRPLKDFQHPQFEGRVKLNDPALHGNLSITLQDVRQKDIGSYECHVFSKSHGRDRRSVLGTRPIRTIDLTVEPLTIQAFPGQDVLLRLPKPDYNVTSLMWKREDDPEHFVFLSGMGHPHHQHPLYSGRTELTPDRTGDLTVTLRNVQPGDSGTYRGYIEQYQHRAKRELRPSEPDNIVILQVLSSGALELEGGAAFTIAVIMLLFLDSSPSEMIRE